jgi:hypothetical protein
MVDNYDFVSQLLFQRTNSAIETQDKDEVKFIRGLWDNESWESIQKKIDEMSRGEGSRHIVWLDDGIGALARHMYENP